MKSKKMSIKSFISCNLSETKDLRTYIKNELKENVSYFEGEYTETPYSEDDQTKAIKETIVDQIADSQVVIILASIFMLQNDWIEWEVNYALGNEKIRAKSNTPKGVICVIQNIYGKALNTTHLSTYTDWAKHGDNWNYRRFQSIITRNVDNKKEDASMDLSKDYITFVEQDDFVNDMEKYIKEAYEKSVNVSSYYIRKIF